MAALLLVIVAALPAAPVVETTNYEYQLHVAYAHHLQWGVDLAATYGPWGFIGLPFYHPSTIGLMLALNALVLCVTAVRIRVFLHRVRPAASVPWLWPAAVILPLACLPVREWTAALFCFPVLAVVIGLEWVTTDDPTFTVIDILTTVVLALLTLVKISVWPVALALTAAAFLTSRQIGVRFTTWFAGSVLFWWLAAGQSLAHVPAYLALGLEVIRGYKNGMAVWTVSVANQVWFGVGAAALLGSAALSARPRHRNQWLIFVVPALALAQLFQGAYVRADPPHIVSNGLALASLAPLFFAVVARTFSLLATASALAIVVSLVRLFQLTDGEPEYNRPRQQLNAAAERLQHGTTELREARANLITALRALYPLPAQLHSGAVGMMAGDLGVLEANPVTVSLEPTVTSYGAYTDRLQQLNEQWVEKADGMLWCGAAALDGRYPTATDSRALVSVIEHFEQVEQRGPCAILRRSSREPWLATEIREHRVMFNQRISVPSPPGALVEAEIDVKERPLGSLASIFLRPGAISLHVILRDGSEITQPLTPAASAGPMLLSPYALTWEPYAEIARGQQSDRQVVGLDIRSWSAGAVAFDDFYRRWAAVRLTVLMPSATTPAADGRANPAGRDNPLARGTSRDSNTAR